jgi:hypothetical protein
VPQPLGPRDADQERLARLEHQVERAARPPPPVESHHGVTGHAIQARRPPVPYRVADLAGLRLGEEGVEGAGDPPRLRRRDVVGDGRRRAGVVGPTIDRLFEAFLAAQEARLSPKSFEKYEEIVHLYRSYLERYRPGHSGKDYDKITEVKGTYSRIGRLSLFSGVLGKNARRGSSQVIFVRSTPGGLGPTDRA